MKFGEKQIAFLFFLIFFVLSVAICTESSAQMLAGHPKSFRFSGLAELQYKSYYTETSSARTSHDNEYSNIKNRLKLNLDGYVYHPRLIVFNSSIDISFFKSLTGVDIKGRDLGYFLHVTALPYRPVSLDIFASRNHYSFEAKTQALPDRTVNHYGARLRVNLEKLKPIRLIRLRYEHWDYNTEGVPESSKSNSYSLNVNGLLTKINTSYIFSATKNSYSSPVIDIDSKLLNFFTDTNLTKKGLKLITSLFYIKNEDSLNNTDKELTFGANLSFPPGERYFHQYNYIYDKSEFYYPADATAGTSEKLIKGSYKIYSGSWGYRITDRLMSSLSLDYGKRKIDGDSGSLKGLSTTLSYRRSLAGFSFESAYRFIMRKDELREDSKEHWISINFKRNLRIGTAYLTYTHIKSDSESDVFASEDDLFYEEGVPIGKHKASVLSHAASLGIRGRGFGSILRRAIWTIEGSYFNTKVDIERPRRHSLYDDDYFYFDEEDSPDDIERITKKSDQYSFYAQLILPIRTRMNLNARATYTFGETDSVSRESYMINASLNYMIYRNLIFTGLWRGKWDKIENRPTTRRVFDYEAALDYHRGKFSCLLEFYLSDTEEGGLGYFSRRVFFTVKRHL